MKALLSIVLLLSFSVLVWAVTPEELEEEKKYAEKGNVAAQYNLGTIYAHGMGVPQDFKEAAKWLRKAAERGDAEAQRYIASMYNKGKGVPEDDKEANKWFLKAAEQGYVDAQYNLGGLYFFGNIKQR